MVIVTTNSDMYFDCVLTTQDGKYVDIKDKRIVIKIEVRDENFIAVYDTHNHRFINCVTEYEDNENGEKVLVTQKKIVPYVRDEFGKMCVPIGCDEFKMGYVDCIRIFIAKHTFSESGVAKVSICNITRDNTFRDKTQEVWSLTDTTTIKYKAYE